MLHVICGAPCAGKTTYVEQNAKKGDLIIDADKIANAFGGDGHQAKGDPFKVALKARSVAIEYALNSDNETWLIDTMPSEDKLDLYKQAGADIVVIDTDKNICLERAKERPVGTAEAIEKYYRNTDALQKIRSSEADTRTEGEKEADEATYKAETEWLTRAAYARMSQNIGPTFTDNPVPYDPGPNLATDEDRKAAEENAWRKMIYGFDDVSISESEFY